MPVELEKKLIKQALKKGFKRGSERFNRYVYGKMRETGWTPSHQKKKKKK